MYHWGHLFLAYPFTDEAFGVFIADAIKGANWQNFPQPIARGILFHRWVDHKTDHNQNFQHITRAFRPVCGKYAPIIADWLLDYFLLCRIQNQADTLLAHIQKHFIAYENLLPPRWQSFYTYAIRQGNLLQMKKLYGFKYHLHRFITRRNLPIEVSSIFRLWWQKKLSLSHYGYAFWDEALHWHITNYDG